jgi:hypothetical protein
MFKYNLTKRTDDSHAAANKEIMKWFIKLLTPLVYCLERFHAQYQIKPHAPPLQHNSRQFL